MYFGRVIGSVVATKKDEKLKGCKLLVIQKTNRDGESEGSPIIAVDHTQAGYGDFVFYTRSKDAAFPFKNRETPVDAGIMGIIDFVTMER